MKHHFAFLVLAATVGAGSPLSAQPAAPALPMVEARVAALRDAALKDDLAWTIVEGLTTEVGPRLAGTEPKPARATGRWQGSNRSVSPMCGSRNSTCRFGPAAPKPRKSWRRSRNGWWSPRSVTAHRPAPPGVQGEVVGFNSLAELEAAPASSVQGKIVFVSHAMPRTQDGSGYGYFGGPRRQGPTIASQKGALAIVVRSIGTDYHRNPHAGAQQFADGVAPIPAGRLGHSRR